MFAQHGMLFKGLLTLVCALALIAVAGCGEDDDPAGSTGAATESTSTDPTEAEPGEPEIADADPDDLAVIEDWSETLSSGDVEGAAALFALPSTAENGPFQIEIETLEDAIAFNETLPCGAEVISAETDGDLTTATFRLSDRPGGGCGQGAGGQAQTSFLIEDGEIVEWRRIDGLPAEEGPAPGDPV